MTNAGQRLLAWLQKHYQLAGYPLDKFVAAIEAEAAQEAPTPEGLRAALAASGFEPESNVCRACGHDGGQHDLRNWCLVCPRPEVEIGPTDHSVDKRVAAGWCFFSSMGEDERWEHSVKRLRAALAATPPTPAEPPSLARFAAMIEEMDRAEARPPGGLDARRVAQAIENVAKRHGIVKDPPMPLSLARIYGYSTTPADMDAQIEAEYARLSAGGATE